MLKVVMMLYVQYNDIQDNNTNFTFVWNNYDELAPNFYYEFSYIRWVDVIKGE